MRARVLVTKPIRVTNPALPVGRLVEQFEVVVSGARADRHVPRVSSSTALCFAFVPLTDVISMVVETAARFTLAFAPCLADCLFRSFTGTSIVGWTGCAAAIRVTA